MFKTKILILGPPECGKSTIANYLADAADNIGDYRPTQGVRILEFESNGLELNGKNINAEVELWDCSGDVKFKPCWPAIQKDASGVILVCNPDNEAQIRHLEEWYKNFVSRKEIRSSHVIIFLHQKPEITANVDNLHLPPLLQSIQSVITNIEQDGEALRLEFNNFLCSVIAGQTEQREEAEIGLVN